MPFLRTRLPDRNSGGMILIRDPFELYEPTDLYLRDQLSTARRCSSGIACKHISRVISGAGWPNTACVEATRKRGT
jgi:hypothetical protein